MIETRLSLAPRPPFNFAATANSHGWVVLAPNSWDGERGVIGRVQRLSSGRVVDLAISGIEEAAAPEVCDPVVHIEIAHMEPLAAAEAEEIRAAVAHMLRLDEDLSAFYALCAGRGEPWSRAAGFGRLLRSPTVFEDVVKTIATTNTQWGGTIRMVNDLVAALGEPLPWDETRRAFPMPEAIAAAPPETFTQVARFGYRGPYVVELARHIVAGELDLEEMLRSDAPTAKLKKQLLAIKGVGPYAAATLLMLLGRYDEIGYDTVFRDFVSERYFNGERPPPKEMTAVYDEWCEWRYLAYWLELWDDYTGG